MITFFAPACDDYFLLYIGAELFFRKMIMSNMNKILILLVGVGMIVISAGLFISNIPSKPIYVENPKNLLKSTDPILSTDFGSVIKKLNKKNAKIKNFKCDNMRVLIRRSIITLKLQGSLAYKKNKNFRMKISKRKSEADLGSNGDHFWFWIRRMTPPGLYYAEHKDIYKTRLRTPFHPLWVVESLGLEEIKPKGAVIEKFKNYWKVTELRKSTLRRDVLKVTLIDPKLQLIIGHYIFKQDGTPVASSEVEEWQSTPYGHFPKNIIVQWHEENVSVRFILSDPKINTTIPKETWKMPNKQPKVDMSEN
jgi:hypothetical protein